MLIIVAASFSAPFGTPQLAAFAKDFLPAVATLIAAYAGAWYGATLVREAAQQDERKRNIGVGARTMFTLWRQVNLMAQIQVDGADVYRDNPAAPIAMPPVSLPMNEQARTDLNGLAFFLDLGNIKILEDLAIAEQNFLHALDVVKTRSALHLTEIQPILEKVIPNGGAIRRK